MPVENEKSHREIPMNPEKEELVEKEIKEILEKGAIRTVKQTKGQFASSLFLVPKKDKGQRPVINLKKVEFINTLRTFQDGGPIHIKGTPSGKRFSMQNGSKRCIFYNSITQSFLEICKTSVERNSLLVPMPLIRTSSCSQNIFQANESANILIRRLNGRVKTF